MINPLIPLPPIPRTKALRAKLYDPEFQQDGWINDALELCTTLEQELGVASSGWMKAESNNNTLTDDLDRLRKVLSNVRKALNSVP